MPDIKYIVHIADIHIRTFKQHEDYRVIFEKLYLEISEIVEKYGKEHVRIAILGDVVHQKINISNELVMMVSEFFINLNNLAQVIMIAGNHDLLENNTDRLDTLMPIVTLLKKSGVNIVYLTKSECYLDNNVVWCPYSIFDKNEKPDIISAREKYGDDKTYVGMYHGIVVNAETDLGYTFEHGASHSKFSGCDFVLMGDIHKRSFFVHSDFKTVLKTEKQKYLNNFWVVENEFVDSVRLRKIIPLAYSGSLIQQDFAENVSGHGYLLWDISTHTYTEHNIENDKPLLVFEIKSLDDIDSDREKIVNL